jgi:hypothetical protein
MARKATGRRDGKPAGPTAVKVTLRLSVETAQRLGVEAAMRRVTMSAIAEEVLGPHLRRWRLPSAVEDPAAGAPPAHPD